MSKIIIHNKTDLTDYEALEYVQYVVSKGLISKNSAEQQQYCHASIFDRNGKDLVIVASRRNDTHTFKIYFDSDWQD